MPVIDFHTHIFPPDVIARREAHLQRDRWFGQLYSDPKARMASAEDLIAEMDRSGVDVSVTFGFAWAEQELCRKSNDHVLEATSRWPKRLVGFAVVNPAAEGATDELERCMAAGLRGLGELMPDGQGYTLDDPRVDTAIECMVHWHLPVLVHAGEPIGHRYPGKSQATLQPLYQLALRHPAATLVAAHWGGGLLFYELMPEVRRALRNVYYDTAASPYLYQDAIFALAARIAPDRVLFGSDYPLITQERFVRHVRGAGLLTDNLDAILGGNATRLLGLGAPHTGRT
jgi:predicted TIM-barrel fold metal-dependent hydrolase